MSFGFDNRRNIVDKDKVIMVVDKMAILQRMYDITVIKAINCFASWIGHVDFAAIFESAR